VPHLLQKKWHCIRSELETMAKLNPFGNRVFRLDVYDEAAVAPLLDTLASEWGSEVAIGSYPVRGGGLGWGAVGQPGEGGGRRAGGRRGEGLRGGGRARRAAAAALTQGTRNQPPTPLAPRAAPPPAR
jgi:hypothetical protein